MGFIQKVLIYILLCNQLLCNGSEHEHDHEGTVDPYHEILEFYNLQEENFTVNALEELFHDFAANIHCVEEVHDEGEHEDEEVCADHFCVNVSSVLTSLGKENDPFVSENTFEDISLILLEVAVSFNESCHTVLPLTKDVLNNSRSNVVNRLSGGSVTDGIKLMSVQETLELIDLDNEGHTNNTETDGHSHNESEEHVKNETEEDHSGEDPHHIDLIMEKCLGADTVFDRLGLDLDEHVSRDNAGKIASLVVYNILNGAKVSRECRILPRQGFFFEELDHVYGTGNKTLGTKGFAEVVEALQIGGLHEESHTGEDTHDDHDDHRRKRSTEEADDILHKSSWETKCYTDEELLAIFHAEDSSIPVETFNVICPALVQQKLAGVCMQSEEHDDEHGSQPSKAEKYGYGSIATVIVCLCSVVGAIIVKVASNKAYDIIMALFLGLAVGTLFTDAMVHLLPMALGVHGHSGEEHDHGGDGIVVEEYVWYSLVACAGLYVFYLFEKTMVLVRGQHVHSHGMDVSEEDLRTNEIQISKAEKYTMESMSKKQVKENPKRSFSNIAVMILMGDAVHNFADGLAIGASFTSSIALGLSTSIAVFCHELPHELGDFAILLASGLSFGRALLLNVLVSITAMIGLYVGLVISDDEAVKQWIVAVAAGLFIYISLVDMMPKLLQKSTNGLRDFLLHNVGILFGAGVMIVLAVFEEKIKVTL